MRASLPSILAISVPSLMVLVGILMNQRTVDGLRSDLRDLRGEIGSLRTEVHAMQDTFHNDILMLLQRDADKDTRISVLEERSKPNR